MKAEEIIKILNKYKDGTLCIYKSNFESIAKEIESQPEQPKISAEIQNALDFINENPNPDDYVNQNVENFLNSLGNISDDSPELDKYWWEQLSIVVKYAQQPKTEIDLRKELIEITNKEIADGFKRYLKKLTTPLRDEYEEFRIETAWNSCANFMRGKIENFLSTRTDSNNQVKQ